MPFVFGSFKKFKPIIQELKIFEKGEEIKSVEKEVTKTIEDWTKQSSKMFENPFLQPVVDTFLKNAFPLMPYPDNERCLGLVAAGSDMTIKDGYAVLGFDYNVETAEAHCLFEMAKYLEAMEKMYKDRADANLPGAKSSHIN